MDQNQTASSSDNDLQQAIDNISNSTNADPVFSDTSTGDTPNGDSSFSDDTSGTAYQADPQSPDGNTTIESSDSIFPDAPSPTADDSNMNFGDPSGPFPLPDVDSTVGVVTEGPEPIAPLDPISLPDLSVSGENPADATVVTKPDNTNQNQANPINNSNNNGPEGNFSRNPNPANQARPTSRNSGPSPNARHIRDAALQQLIPHLDRLSIDDSERFRLCKDILEDLHDYSVLDQAYKAASNIQDETERANSLLYLVESIDAM